MTQRARFLIIAFTLAAGLVPGCARPFLHRNPHGVALDAPAGQGPRGSGMASTYHLEHPSLVRQPPRQEPTLEQTRYPIGEPEPVLPPARLRQAATLPSQAPAEPSAEFRVRPPEPPSQGPAPEEPLVLALRFLMSQRPEEAVELLKRYEGPNQDALLRLLALTVRLTRSNLEQDSAQEIAAVLEQLSGLTVMLRPLAALSIERICFCREISRFGVYELVQGLPTFHAGREGQTGERMQVYVELKHFTSLARGALHETWLASKLEIRDDNGGVVSREDFPAQQPDRSHSLRHDYFISYSLPVPCHLRPGKYTLWVEVRDLTGQQARNVPAHRIAQRSLDFRVTPPGTPRSIQAGYGRP